MKKICEDLRAEHEELEALLTGLDQTQGEVVTPFYSWTVKKEVEHLAYFDDRASLAATDPEAFQRHLTEDIGSRLDGIVCHTQKTVGNRSIEELIDWWKTERRRMLAELEKHDPKDRLPWYGPPMSALSFATARLMETWAHAQDVFDAMRLKRRYTDRLRHIAHLGVSTFGWSYIVRGLDVPQTQVRLELTAPSGKTWTWGPKDVAQKISGPVQDFCLVVVQRRHVDDTRLELIGDTARDWMLKAQCFAGPPADGPEPGKRVIIP
jgi:uncharacterized protein (TIGR03084 family)